MKRRLYIFRCLLFILVSIISSLGDAYSQSHIRGIIIDSLHSPIIGTAVIMQDLDSVYINAVTTDTLGHFNLKKETENFRLIFQHLLYDTKEIEVDGNEDIGMIILDEKENLLGEIVVKGERPRIKVENGALQYDVSRIADNKVISSAYESLLQLPGISEYNEQLSLAGASELTVLINGKPTTMDSGQLLNLLKNTSASKIDKAEVIYNAPARYHVRGAVVNLILKENKEDKALQGEVNTAYRQKHYANASAGINFSYSSGKLSTDFLYSFSHNKARSGLNLLSQHQLGDEVFNIEQYDRGYSNNANHNIRFGANYSVTDKNNLSLTYTSQITPDKKSRQNSIGNTLESDIYRKGNENTHNINFDFSTGFGLNVGVDFTHYNSPAIQEFESSSLNDRTVFMANSNQTINRWKAYISQNYVISNTFSVNYGGDFTYVKNDSYQTYDFENYPQSESDSKSMIQEYTYNLYAGIEKKFDNLSLSFSLAGEYYNIEDKGDWSIYPSGQLSYMKSTNHIYQLSFSSNKAYPIYWLWQDNISYLNRYAEVHGNPHLKPATKYNTRFNYILKSKYVFSAYYNHINNYFIQLPYQTPDRLALIYQTVNIDTKQQFGITAVTPFRISDFWDSNLTVDASFNREKANHFHDLEFQKNKWLVFGRLDNTFKLSSTPDIKLEVAGMYMSSLVQGLYDMSDIWQLDAGIKWTFANKQAELSLKASDIFNSFIPDMKVHYANQNLEVFPIKDSRSVSLSFSYKFGNYKRNNIKHVDTSRFGY